MSNINYKSQTDIYSKKRNILSIKSSEKFSSSTHKKKCYKKHFELLSEFEQKKILRDLKVEYSLILFDYFSDKHSIDRKIEHFAKLAFDIDLPMNKVVEIHLDLIEDLEYQLIIEGLCAEYLSDFRLTLINVIAYLGELYRNARSTTVVSD